MVASNGEIVSIPTSKLKTSLILLGSIAFVITGIWLLFVSRSEQSSILIFSVSFIGLASIIFFGICGLYSLTRLFDTQPGLVIDSEGIIDRSSAVSVGRILWRDLRRIDVTRIQNQKFLTFYVINPQKYLQRGGFLQRQMNALNYKLYGSPIHIASNSLKISFGELTNLVFQYYDQYGLDSQNRI